MTRVSYDATDIAAATVKEQLKDGAHVAVVIDKIEKVLSENSPKNPDSGPGRDHMIKWQLSILDPADEQTRLKRHRIFGTTYLPVRDPESPEHIAPEWSHGLFAQFIQAFKPGEHPKAPRKAKGIMMYQGEEIDPKKVAKIEADLAEKRLKEAVDIWGEGEEDMDYLSGYLHLAAYATLKHSQGDGDTVFVNANNLRPELGVNYKTGEAYELTPIDELVEKISTDPAKVNGKAGTTTPRKTAGSPRKTAGRKAAARGGRGRGRARV